MAHVLVIDDEPNMRWVLQESLERAGYQVSAAGSGEEALLVLVGTPVDLIVLDLKMKGMDGLATLRQIHSRYPDIVILILTAYGTVAMAVEAMQAGASDFLRKPFDIEEILFKIGRALERRTMQHELRQLRAMPPAPVPGTHPLWRQAIARAQQGLEAGFDLRLVGETGSGRATIARTAHATSQRRAAPFIEIDLELISAERQSQLFLGTPGHPGIWALAGQGSLLLRHIAALSEAGFAALEASWSQSHLALVMITGSQGDWELLDQSRVSRSSLSIAIPALREHIDDLELFLAEWNEHQAISAGALNLLRTYSWPGNLAELRGVVERARVLAGSGMIEEGHLPAGIRAISTADRPFQLPREGIALEEVEQSLIRQALQYAGGNKSRAAELLGLTRHTLLYRMAKYQIEDS